MDILDDDIKLKGNERIMNCLRPFTQQIFKYILDNSAPVHEEARISGLPVDSHAGDPPDDGNVVTACADADVSHGWHIKPRSGQVVRDRVSNGSMSFPHPAVETSDHWCQDFNLTRSNKGSSGDAIGHAEAVVERGGP